MYSATGKKRMPAHIRPKAFWQCAAGVTAVLTGATAKISQHPELEHLCYPLLLFSAACCLNSTFQHASASFFCMAVTLGNHAKHVGVTYIFWPAPSGRAFAEKLYKCQLTEGAGKQTSGLMMLCWQDSVCGNSNCSIKLRGPQKTNPAEQACQIKRTCKVAKKIKHNKAKANQLKRGKLKMQIWKVKQAMALTANQVGEKMWGSMSSA